MTSDHDCRSRRSPTRERSPEDYVASCVGAAIAPLSRYLSRPNARLLRAVVEASVEADPVSRRLLEKALSLHFRSGRRRFARGRRRKPTDQRFGKGPISSKK